MKKIISVLIIIALLFTFSVSVFADGETEINNFTSLFRDQLPEVSLESTEFEAEVYYTFMVKTPISVEPFTADEGKFEGVRGTIIKKDITCVNAEIIKIEETEDFDFIVTFMPIEEGEFSFEIIMRTFGYDMICGDYRTINGDDWTYTIKSDSYLAVPYAGVGSLATSSEASTDNAQSNSGSSVAGDVTSSDSTSSVITVDVGEEGGISVWVWIGIGIAVVACATVGIILNRKKLIK